MVKKNDLEKNDKQSFFDAVRVFFQNKSAYLPNIFALFLKLY